MEAVSIDDTGRASLTESTVEMNSGVESADEGPIRWTVLLSLLVGALVVGAMDGYVASTIESPGTSLAGALPSGGSHRRFGGGRRVGVVQIQKSKIPYHLCDFDPDYGCSRYVVGMGLCDARSHELGHARDAPSS
jgi:hypothetical protein